MENKYLNEEKYQKSNKKVKKVSLILLLVGILIGGSLIGFGIYNVGPAKKSLQEKVEIEKTKLEAKKSELEIERNNSLDTEKKKLEAKKEELKSKGIEYSAFVSYEDGETYDLYVLTEVLDPSNYDCSYEYLNNSLTSSYCSIKNGNDENSKKIEIINRALSENYYCDYDEIKNSDLTFEYCSQVLKLDKLDSPGLSVPFFMIGGFIIFASCMYAFSLFLVSKRREIMAYTTQQVMPIAKEGIEDIAPTIGVVGKEIAKGVKEGLNEEEKNK